MDTVKVQKRCFFLLLALEKAIITHYSSNSLGCTYRFVYVQEDFNLDVERKKVL